MQPTENDRVMALMHANTALADRGIALARTLHEQNTRIQSLQTLLAEKESAIATMQLELFALRHRVLSMPDTAFPRGRPPPLNHNAMVVPRPLEVPEARATAEDEASATCDESHSEDEQCAPRDTDEEASKTTATVPPAYQCPDCPARFEKRASLVGHRKVHADKPFRCALCPKTFMYQSTLANHQRTHTKPFPCPRCPRTFAHARLLEAHETACRGEPLHECDQCGRVFTTHHGLSAHKRLHSDTGSYACDHCPQSFLTWGHRHTHLRRVHGVTARHPMLNYQ